MIAMIGSGSIYRLTGWIEADLPSFARADHPRKVLGTATTQANGSICQNMTAVPASRAGAHYLVAVQSGAAAAQAAITFVLPSPRNGSTGGPSGAAGVAKVRIPRGFFTKPISP